MSTHSAPRKILLLRFSSLGDLVLSTGLLEALSRPSPAPQVTLATKVGYADLFREDPRVAELVTLDAEPGAFKRMWRTLSARDFDEILDAHSSLRSRLLTWLLPPAPLRRIGKDAVARMLFVALRIRTRALRRNQRGRYARLLGLDELPAPRLHLDPDAQRFAESVLPGGPYLAMAPGARHRPKQWPIERFEEVARAHLMKGDGAVAVFGSPPERALGERLASKLGERCVNLVGRLDLAQLAACLARCSVTLCNDSGILHMSEAVGTPVMALFGPTSRELGFFPQLANSRVIEHALPCRPCSRNGARPCRMPENWCLTRSTPELVLSQLEVQWARVNESPQNPG